eukprot:gene7700-186_t
MGHIERLEVENFKSYKGEHVIGPFKRFSCIMGPNGSGKSNITEALSFVFGIRSTAIRGSHLKDLIYQTESDRVGTRKARVELVFVDDNGKEWQFRRSISAAGDGSYHLQATPVTWARYDSTLQQFNILSSARNFLVFQGDVMSLALRTPKELTEFFEQVHVCSPTALGPPQRRASCGSTTRLTHLAVAAVISGSIRFKEEYEDLDKKYQTAKASFLDTSAKRRGVGAQKTQFKTQKREADKWNDRSAELDGLRSEAMLFKLYRLEVTLRRKIAEAAEQHVPAAPTEAIEKLQSGGGHGEDELAIARRELQELGKERLLAEKKLKDQNNLTAQMRVAHNMKVNETEKLEAKLTALKAQLAATKASDKKRGKERQELDRQLLVVEKQFSEFLKEGDPESHEDLSQLGSQDWNDFSDLKQQAIEGTLKFHQEQQQQHHKLSMQEEVFKGLSLTAEHLADRRTTLGHNINQLQDQVTQLKTQHSEQEAKSKKCQDEFAEVEREMDQREVNHKKLQQGLEEVAVRLTDLRTDRQASKREQQIEEALNHFEKTLGTNKIKGKLMNMVTVTDKTKYRIAATVACGKHMDSIVVDSEHTAEQCIQALRESRVPPMTFLPLSSIQPPEFDDSYRSLGGTARPVLDVLTFDPEVEPAIRYAVGNTLVCDSLPEARKIAFDYGPRDKRRYKVVTVDGSIIHKSGCIQGGQESLKRKAAKWDDKEFSELKRKRDVLFEQIQSLPDLVLLQNKRMAAHTNANIAQSQLVTLKTDLKVNSDKIAAYNKEIDQIAKQQQNGKPHMKEVEANVKTLQSTVAKVQAQIKKVEDKVFSDFSQRTGITDVRAYEQQALTARKQHFEKKAEYQMVIHKLKSQIELEKEKELLSSAPAELQKVIKEVGDQLVKNKSELEVQKTKTIQIQAACDKADGLLKQTIQQKVLKDKAFQNLSFKWHDNTKAAATAHKALQSKQSAIQQLRAERCELVHRCQLEEISLPSKDVDTENSEAPEHNPKRRRGAARPGLVQSEAFNPAQAYGLSPMTNSQSLLSQVSPSQSRSKSRDKSGSRATRGSSGTTSSTGQKLCVVFEDLRSDLVQAAGDAKAFERTADELDQTIRRMEEEMDTLRPNLKAAERLQKIKPQLEETEQNYEDALKSMKTAQHDFMVAKEKRTQAFMATWDQMTQNIDPVYKALTGSNGMAFLGLEDSAEPWSSGVFYSSTPPNKHYRDLEQLSGGEKTISALALLYTVQAIRPSPFFILDEIDAHLDAVNVDHVLRYILKHKQATQFIVVSLRNQFYAKADSLVGVLKRREAQSSDLLTFDLSSYADDDDTKRLRATFETNQDYAYTLDWTVSSGPSIELFA